MAAFQGKYGEIASRQKEYKKECSNLSAQRRAEPQESPPSEGRARLFVNVSY